MKNVIAAVAAMLAAAVPAEQAHASSSDAGKGVVVAAPVDPLSSERSTRAEAQPASTEEDGRSGRWVVTGPDEIVAWLLFDPASVDDRLPADLRFVNVAELATGNVHWARAWLEDHPGHGGWGISFLEIVRADRFEIDGQAPHWPADGAYALWAARVVPLQARSEEPEGLPLLILDAWLPDEAYVARMRALGHYATFGDVALDQADDGRWRGAITVPDLTVVAECLPTGPVTGGPESAGQQVLFPPRSAGVDAVVQVVFAGHRVQNCADPAVVSIRGDHPLSLGIVLEPASFQTGYTLDGMVLPR